MPYQQPLTPFILHCADPVDLPVRPLGDGDSRGDGVLSRVTRAGLVAQDGGGVALKADTSDGQSLVVDVRAAAEGVIRVRLGPDAETRTRSAPAITLIHATGYDGGRVEVEPGRIRVHAGAVSAHIELDPWRLRFLDPDGRLLVEQNTYEMDISDRLRNLPFGRSTVAGEVAAYHETFAAPGDEHFFGLGEKFTMFDKRGQRIIMWNYDAFSAESERSYKNVPFYLSSRGYGVLVDSGTATEFDMCHSTHACVQITVPDDVLDYYLIAGPTPERVIDRYHRLTGRPYVPPKWALGTWISSGFSPDSQRRVLKRARKIRDHGIPCDVLHIDAHWMPTRHWSDLRWDAKRFPDPESMLAELAGMGFRTCLWLNPYVGRESPLFAEAAANGYFLARADGTVYEADVWHTYLPPCGIVDFTNPRAVRWYQGLLRDLLRQGVDCFKTDFGEGVPVDAVAANGMRGDGLHNVYSLLFNDAVADVTEEVTGHRLVWARSSFTGGQRHSAQWAGDTTSSFPSMASTLRGGLSYALSGVPFWSHDVGGFTGEPTPELFVRSAQFGAFSPLTRFHGNTPRHPWSFEPAVEQAVIEALRLRYQLMPYLYSASVTAGASSLPVLRPLLLAAPDEPATWSADLEYLLGPDLLVAPMTTPENQRHVYLPVGRWIDYWTGEVHDGGRHIRAVKPLEQVPLYVRWGALIPTTRAADTVGSGPFTDLTLVCWGDGDGSVVVHDEGTSTAVTVRRQGGRFEVACDGPLAIDRVAFPPVAGAATPSEVLLDGRPTALETVDGWQTAAVRHGPA
ncbi:TIM-barrel domain-containing protein [Micromonospora sp. CPCC 206061]|uniref:TIM-barrel domain-containing protein n=1 Tax=Micromonospora sp. CPCC 206061 TaxID=3122410 RepID=UPI002FF206D8